MKNILEAVLTDPSMRNANAIEALASAQDEFLTWQ
jgi:hypothetical protein